MLKRLADRVERILTSDSVFPLLALAAALIAISAIWCAATAVPENPKCDRCGREAIWFGEAGEVRCGLCIPDDL